MDDGRVVDDWGMMDDWCDDLGSVERWASLRDDCVETVNVIGGVVDGSDAAIRLDQRVLSLDNSAVTGFTLRLNVSGVMVCHSVVEGVTWMILHWDTFKTSIPQIQTLRAHVVIHWVAGIGQGARHSQCSEHKQFGCHSYVMWWIFVRFNVSCSIVRNVLFSIGSEVLYLYRKCDFFRLGWDENFSWETHIEKSCFAFRVLLTFCFDCVFGKENLASRSEQKILVQDIIIGVGTDRTNEVQC